jgi:DNA polymerase-3 subunit epsilon
MNWRTANLLAIDTETTGPDPFTADVVELGACSRDVAGRFVRLGQLVRPPCAIPPEATAIHGIRDADVADKPMLHDVAVRFLEHVNRADVLIGYNWPYDHRVFQRALGDSWDRAIAGKPVIDSVVIVRLDDVGRYWKGTGRHKLDAVATRLGISVRGSAHRASRDAELAIRIALYFARNIPEDATTAHEYLIEQRKRQDANHAAYRAAQASAGNAPAR